jgi:hypothetical protein
MMTTLRVSLVLAAYLVASPVSAQGQRLILGEMVRQGQTVEVIDDHGRQINGKVSTLSTAAVRIVRDGKMTEIPFENIAQIARPADSLANGAWIGFASGAAFGAIGALGTTCDYDYYCFDGPGYAIGSTLIFGAIGAGIGVGVDALIKHNRIIYQRDAGAQTRVAPVIGPGLKGAAVSVSW